MPRAAMLATIVGAGPGGAMLAALLARRGWRVRVIERHADPRGSTLATYPSINLALSYRGLKALDQVGVLDALGPRLIPMKGRMIHSGGREELQRYDLVGTRTIFSVRRTDLLGVLLDAAESSGARLAFSTAAARIDLAEGSVTAVDQSAGIERPEPFGLLLGADGCHSVVRQAIDAAFGVESAIGTLEHGYRELPISADAARRANLAPDALHIWPRGAFMLIALPNADGSFTATLFLAHDGPQSFEALRTPGTGTAFFERHFPDALPFFPALETAFTSGRTGRIMTIAAPRWRYEDQALILGDAAHAMAPFYGQGVNCAFEDCTSLVALLDRCGGSAGAAFCDFETRRKDDARAISDISLANYREMRHSVTDEGYRAGRDLATALQQRFPDRFVPLYAMVSFSDVPYAAALARHRVQEAIIRDLLNAPAAGAVDWAMAERLVDDRLADTVPLSQEHFYSAFAGA